ncbi:hypothetical protein B1207_04575 [Legionella quinlivanii]|uniref:Uncharacterized protein n=1 Tax=Legionella quinlivanii TaxID=45073 RepID=A0A364LL38_9GAMM|nr:hypothetical protein B1207_04575 [Legionella quinlivanii]
MVYYPAVFLYSLLYKPLAPLALRISGIVCSLLWFSGFAYWCLRITQSKKTGLFLFVTLIACTVSLGVIPFLMIFARPEQLMITIIMLLFLYCLFWQPIVTQKVQWFALAIFLLLSSCFFFVHAKSLFFLPFFIIVAYLITKKSSIIVTFSVIFFLLILSYQNIADSNLYTQCQNEAPIILALFKANTLLPSDLITSPITFFKKGFLNLASTPAQLINHAIFQPSYQSSWLPTTSNSNYFIQFLNNLISSMLYLVIIGSHIGVVIVFLFNLFKRSLSKPILLGGMLALGSLANAFFYNMWNFYGLSQAIPISMMLILTLLPTPYTKYPSFQLKTISIILMIVSLMSMCTLLYRTLPLMVLNSSSTDSDIKDQYLSIPTFSQEEQVIKIQKLAKKCGIPFTNTEHLVVDHQTYFAFPENKFPIHVLYISEVGYGGDLVNGKLEILLRKLHSPGVIARCSYLSPQLVKQEKIVSEGYCCIKFK